MHRARVSPDFTQISTDGPTQNCGGCSSLQARPRRCASCTDPGFSYSGSPSPKLPFYMHLALVQTLYRARGSPNFNQISTHDPTLNCCGRSNLQARPRRCAFCAEPGLPYSGSPSPKLPFHMHLAMVQTLYRARGSPDFAQISTHGPTLNFCGRSNLHARPRGCAFCTKPGLPYSCSPPLSFLFICTLHWCKHCTGVIKYWGPR